jgi:hypothetical protein
MLEGMKRMAVQVSARTGLKEATCLDLLLSGWSFHQQVGEPDQWVSSSVGISLPKAA